MPLLSSRPLRARRGRRAGARQVPHTGAQLAWAIRLAAGGYGSDGRQQFHLVQ
jgi:hypothetical protein